MRVRGRAPGLVLGAVLAVACATDADPGDPAFALRDSAGVVIAENADPDPPSWSLDQAPVVDLAGDEEGHEPFFRLRSVTALADGGMAVVNADTEIRFYDPDGGLAAVVGREGEGPGEFRFLTWLEPLPGDTLAAFDHSLRRVSFLDPGRGFVRSVRIELPRPEAPREPYFFTMGSTLGMLHDRTVVGSGRNYVRLEGRPGHRVARGRFVRVDTAGAVLDTLGTFRMGEFWERRQGERPGIASVPFPGITRIEIAGDRILVSEGPARRVDVYAPDGGLLRSIRELRPLRPVTPEDLEAWRRERAEGDGPGPPPSDAPAPDSFPAYGSISVDDRDRLWVAEFPRPADRGRDWRVFDPDGRLLGRLHTPHRFSLHDIRGDRLYGIWYDEVDVPHLRVYRFREG